MRKLIVAAAALLFVGAACADTVSDKFGNRVTQFHQYKAPYLAPDLDGDGAPDAVYLVTIAAGSRTARIAPDVTVASDVFKSKPLGNASANMALGIVFGKSGKKYLLTGYRTDEYEEFFDASMWNETSMPIRFVARVSDEFRKCQAREPYLKADYLSLRGDGDYEDIVWWNGKTFRPGTFSPDNAPCTLLNGLKWK